MLNTANTKFIPRHVKEAELFEEISRAPPVAEKIPNPRNRADVEPRTSNLTLYGVSPAPLRALSTEPATFAPRDWESVTHSQYKPLPHVAISKGMQIERTKAQLSSDLPLNEESLSVFNPSAGFSGRESQMSTDFRPHNREWYVNREPSFSIGGAHSRTRSDVVIKESDRLPPDSYETLAKRQYHSYPIDAGSNSRDLATRKANKLDMISSHFCFGSDKTEYKTAAKQPMETTKAFVKNAPQTTVKSELNPFIAHSAKDARPNKLSAKEVALKKATSSVPVLTKNNPEYYRYSEWPSTSTNAALPSWNPNRCGNMGSSLQTCSSHVKLGHATPNDLQWLSATKTSFKGFSYKE